jgi:T5SS/PEP-CTERM-associated repeat protein
LPPQYRAALVALCAAIAVSLFTSARPALAQVNTSGIVYAFQAGMFVPLPPDGNDLDFVVNPNPPPPDNRDTFEFNLDPLPLGDNEEAIIVGKGGAGSVVILENTVLRSEHLIIGDTGTVGTIDRGGTGTFRVTGFGASFNNAIAITDLLPSVLNVYPYPGTARPTVLTRGEGYDVIVGRRDPSAGVGLVGGTGTLWIDSGGSVQVEDALLVANDQGSRGTIVVDGPETYLASGGFDMGNVNDVHSMIIGRHGIGTMTVSNGATVVSEAFAGTAPNTFVNLGAVIGSDPTPDAGGFPLGGHGTVTVTGVASSIPSPPEVPSKWVIGGSLQIGGFDDANNVGVGRDFEGDDVDYPTQTGVGTLRVNDGGVVTIRAPITGLTQADRLMLAIGRFGRLELDNGSVLLGDSERTRDFQLISDGTITGAGRIDTGLFDNRLQGQLLINAGQKMIIAASADIPDGITTPPTEPLLNHGLIEVIGTVDNRAELEIERALDTMTPLQAIKRLINRLVILPGAPGSTTRFNGGLINVQHGTLRLGSGMFNEGVLAFTAGTNIVKGTIINRANVLNGFAPRIRFEANTTTTFEDDLVPGAFPAFQHPTAVVHLLDPGTFVSVGLDMGLTLSNPIPFSAAGNIAINGPIKVTLENDVVADLIAFGPSRRYTLIQFGGEAYYPTLNGDIWEPDYSSPLPDCSVVAGPCGLFTVVTPSTGSFGPAFSNHLAVTQRIGDRIMLTFVNLASIGVGLIGDYNNDGKVDAGDYVVWKKNEGTMNMLPNDPFGGIIGSNQYNAWRNNFGMMAGVGSGAGGFVPEPASIWLVLCAAWLPLARRRRR